MLPYMTMSEYIKFNEQWIVRYTENNFGLEPYPFGLTDEDDWPSFEELNILLDTTCFIYDDPPRLQSWFKRFRKYWFPDL